MFDLETPEFLKIKRDIEISARYSTVIYFWNIFLVLITLFGLLYSVLTSMLYVRALTLCMGTKLKWERMMILTLKLGVWII